MSLWLMGKADLAELQKNIDGVRAGLFNVEIGSDRPITFVVDGVSVLRIHKTIFARDDFWTGMMGLTSTERYMELFQELVGKGLPILLDVDSPGGDPALLFEFAEMIYEAGAQVSSYTSGTAASAGFLIHQAAQGNRFVAEGAVLGSAGVVATMRKPSDDTVVVLSRNAGNKRGKQGLQSIVDQIEDQFHSSLSKFTGLSRDQIVQGGNEGGEIIGSNAVAVGFATAVTNFKGALAQINSDKVANQPEGNQMTDFTQAELDAAVESATESVKQAAKEAQLTAVQEAVNATNERYARLAAHRNGSNFKAVARLAKSSMSIEEALEHMNDIAPVTDSSSSSAETEADLVARMNKAASEAAAAAVAAIRAEASNTTGLRTETETSAEGEDDQVSMELARVKAANARRAAKGAKV